MPARKQLLCENSSAGRFEFAAGAVSDLKNWLPSDVVYDVGAGEGVMRKPVEKQGMTWRGFDIRPADASITRWDLDEPCPGGAQSAGMILLIEVIEHLFNPGVALRNIHGALRVGGRLLVTTPNPRWSRSRLYALRSGFLACFTQDDLDRNGHVFPIWPHSLVYLLERAGFTAERYVTLDGPTPWPRGPLSLRYPLRVCHAAVNRLIEWRDPTACGMSYAVIARRDA